MTLLLPLLFGFAVLLIFIGMALPGEPSQVQARLQAYGTRPRTLAEMEMSMPFSDRVILPIIRGMSNFISRFAPQRNVDAARHKLDLAGNPNDWTAADFLGVRGLAAIVTAGITGFLFWVMRAEVPQILLFIGIGAILGFELPLFWLNNKIARLQHDLKKALPDALDLLTISVE